jgi:hypothetical protein
MRRIFCRLRSPTSVWIVTLFSAVTYAGNVALTVTLTPVNISGGTDGTAAQTSTH